MWARGAEGGINCTDCPSRTREIGLRWKRSPAGTSAVGAPQAQRDCNRRAREKLFLLLSLRVAIISAAPLCEFRGRQLTRRTGVVQERPFAVAGGETHRNRARSLPQWMCADRNTRDGRQRRKSELRGNRGTRMQKPVVADFHEAGRESTFFAMVGLDGCRTGHAFLITAASGTVEYHSHRFASQYG